MTANTINKSLGNIRQAFSRWNKHIEDCDYTARIQAQLEAQGPEALDWDIDRNNRNQQVNHLRPHAVHPEIHKGIAKHIEILKAAIEAEHGIKVTDADSQIDTARNIFRSLGLGDKLGIYEPTHVSGEAGANLKEHPGRNTSAVDSREVDQPADSIIQNYADRQNLAELV